MLDSVTRWEPESPPPAATWSRPPLFTALGRGLLGRCPACGAHNLFSGYLTVIPKCRTCEAPLGLVRADDAPPYFTIFAVAHVIVPAMFMVERAYAPPLLVQAAIWLPLTLILSLVLLRPIKGATVGLMLRLGMLKDESDRD